MWFREQRPPVRLGHAPLVPDLGLARRLLRRREHRARRVRPRPRPRPPRQLRRRQRLQGRRRPDVLADEAEGRLQRPRLRAVRRRPLQQAYDVRASHDALQHLPRRRRPRSRSSVADASVTSGSMVDLHRDPHVAGDGRLSNNPSSGGTVVLQRRTSVAAWTDVMTMGGTSTAGTYTASLTVRVDAGLPVRCSASQSNEGLERRRSPAVAITCRRRARVGAPQSSSPTSEHPGAPSRRSCLARHAAVLAARRGRCTIRRRPARRSRHRRATGGLRRADRRRRRPARRRRRSIAAAEPPRRSLAGRGPASRSSGTLGSYTLGRAGIGRSVDRAGDRGASHGRDAASRSRSTRPSSRDVLDGALGAGHGGRRRRRRGRRATAPSR